MVGEIEVVHFIGFWGFHVSKSYIEVQDGYNRRRAGWNVKGDILL